MTDYEDHIVIYRREHSRSCRHMLPIVRTIANGIGIPLREVVMDTAAADHAGLPVLPTTRRIRNGAIIGEVIGAMPPTQVVAALAHPMPHN